MSAAPFPARDLWRYVRYPRYSLIDLALITLLVNVLRDVLGWLT